MSDSHQSSPCHGCGGVLIENEAARDGIGRRTFLVQSALMAAAAALAACATVDTTAPNIPTGTTIDTASFSALTSVGGIALVTVNSAQLAVVRTGASSFVVLSRVCQHQGGIVNVNGSGFLCPNHGARYDATGQWVGGQQAGNLRTYTNTFNATTGVLSIG